MNCPSCAASVAQDANFCPFCGLDLRDVHESAAPKRERQQAVTPGGGSGEATVTLQTARSREAGDAGLQTCPRCGAPNGPRRGACGRCGADLSSDRPAPSRDAVVEEPVQVVPPPPPLRWRLILAIITVSALVGTAAGAFVWMRMREEEPAERATAFDREVYPDSPGPLEVAEVSATSTLAPRGAITYAAALVADGDPQTAWNEGAEPGPGEGEAVTIRLAEPAWVAQLVIRNGYQKDQATFFHNTRAARLLARLDDGSLYELVLLDRMGEQVVELPVPALTGTLVLEVVAAYPGLHYEDLALSEIVLHGWVARGADREAAISMSETPSAR